MSIGAKATLAVIAAFLVGAIAPLLGIIAAAACVGALWASSRAQHTKAATPEVLELIREIEEAERKRLR